STPPSDAPAPEAASAASGTVDVVNATNRNGLAAELEHALSTTGFTPGATSNGRRHLNTTMIYYPDPGSAGAAKTLAGTLGGPPTELDTTVPAGHLRVVLGADYTMPAALASAPTTPTPPAPGPNQNDAGPTDPNSVSGGGIPCVK
ncbi:MAG: LytR C-terminal domain-containing protein, partial [Pseudonocardiaceae bacterium]